MNAGLLFCALVPKASILLGLGLCFGLCLWVSISILWSWCCGLGVVRVTAMSLDQTTQHVRC